MGLPRLLGLPRMFGIYQLVPPWLELPWMLWLSRLLEQLLQ
jgi:hypothetical protein